MNRKFVGESSNSALTFAMAAIAIASSLSLTGCGSSGGGALSKGAGPGVASSGSTGVGAQGPNDGSNNPDAGSTGGAGTGTASTGGTATAGGTSGGMTATGTGSTGGPGTTGTTGTAGTPPASTRQAALSSWDQVVGGVGQTVMHGGTTISALGTMTGNVNDGTWGGALSAILTGTGGAVYGVGSGLTTGLEGIPVDQDPVDPLAAALGLTAGQFGKNVSDVGTAISSSGSKPSLLAAIFAPTTAGLGSTIYTTGVNLSGLQFDSDAMLTSGTVQQISAAVEPLLVPVGTGVIELTSAVGTKTGLGAPVDGLITQVGNAVATTGVGVASSSSSPVIQGLGGTVAAAGVTVAAVGSIVHDGQPASTTPMVAITNGSGSLLQGGAASLQSVPGGPQTASLLGSVTSVVTTTVGAVVPTSTVTGLSGMPAVPSALASAAPVASVSTVSGVVSSTATGGGAPIVPISALQGLPSNTAIPSVNLLAPIAATATSVVSGLKNGVAALSVSPLTVHPAR